MKKFILTSVACAGLAWMMVGCASSQPLEESATQQGQSNIQTEALSESPTIESTPAAQAPQMVDPNSAQSNATSSAEQ